MLVKRYDEENIGQTLIEIERKDEELLAMWNIAKDKPSELERKIDYPFIVWVGKYFTEMEDQGCTRIACISRGLLDMHNVKGKPHELPLWVVYYSLETSLCGLCG